MTSIEKAEVTYSFAKLVYLNKIDSSIAVNELENIGINRNSTEMNINAFLKLMSGDVFTFSISYDFANIFLKNIERDFGEKYKLVAQQSLKQRCDYVDAQGRVHNKKLDSLLKNL